VEWQIDSLMGNIKTSWMKMLYSVELDGKITANGRKVAAGYGTCSCGSKIMKA
jgi:hypothetical protein